MWFKHPAWIPVAWALAGLNVVAVWFAAVPGEPLHATLHAALGAGFAAGARHLAMRRQRVERGDDLQLALDENEALRDSVLEMQPRLMELEERLDFAERLLAHRSEAGPVRAPTAAP